MDECLELVKVSDRLQVNVDDVMFVVEVFQEQTEVVLFTGLLLFMGQVHLGLEVLFHLFLHFPLLFSSYLQQHFVLFQSINNIFSVVHVVVELFHNRIPFMWF